MFFKRDLAKRAAKVVTNITNISQFYKHLKKKDYINDNVGTIMQR